MTTPSPLLITNLDDAKNGVLRFHHELEQADTADFISLLGSFQAWYAIPGEDGQLLLAPGKFIGIQGMGVRHYRNISRNIDGRATEAVLARWFCPADATSSDLLLQTLASLLGRFGKKLNKRVRVSMLKGHSLSRDGFSPEAAPLPSPLEALLVFYGLLSVADQREFRRRITH